MTWKVKYQDLSILAKLASGPFAMVALLAGLVSVVVGAVMMVPIFTIALLDGGRAIQRDFPKLKDINGRD